MTGKFLLLMVMGLWLAGVPFASAAEPVKIGALYNLTGDMAPIDGPALKGVKLQAKLLNQAGGLLKGRQIEVVSIDTRSDVRIAAAAAGNLLSQGVAAAIGYGDTNYVLAAAPVFQAKGVPFITSGATLPDLPRLVGDCLFMIAFGDDDQAAALAAFSRTRLKAQTAVIWTDKTMDFAKALAGYFRQSFSQQGGKILQEEFFSSGNRDFSGPVAKLAVASTKIGLVFIAGGPEDAARAVKQIREAGINTPIAGGDSFDSEALIKIPGPKLAHDLYFSTHLFRGENGPEARAFLAAFQKEYGQVPKDAFAALGFDSMGLLAAAIQRAGTTEPRALCRALSQTRDYPGITGAITCRAHRAPAKPVAIVGVRQGRFQPLWTWKPAEKK